MNIRKYIIIIVVIFIVSVAGYFIFSKQQLSNNIDTDQIMTKQLCEEYGGLWGEMEIMRDAGDDIFYQCECPNKGPWIKQGQIGSCK
ncbi:hypothetical protein ACFLZ0_01015 [Patescibacteria group bacterium]